MHASFVPYRWKIGWQYLDYGNFATFEGEFCYVHRRLWQYVAIRTNRTEILQQIVSHLQSRQCTVIIDTDQKVAGPAMIRKVIRESADRLAEFVCAVYRRGPFHTIRLQICQ